MHASPQPPNHHGLSALIFFIRFKTLPEIVFGICSPLTATLSHNTGRPETRRNGMRPNRGSASRPASARALPGQARPERPTFGVSDAQCYTRSPPSTVNGRVSVVNFWVLSESAKCRGAKGRPADAGPNENFVAERGRIFTATETQPEQVRKHVTPLPRSVLEYI